MSKFIALFIGAMLLFVNILMRTHPDRKMKQKTVNDILLEEEYNKIERGRKVFESEQKDNPCSLTAPVGRIIVHEYFTSSHDDTATTYYLQDIEGNTLWETTIRDDRETDGSALLTYLKNRFHCPVEEKQL